LVRRCLLPEGVIARPCRQRRAKILEERSKVYANLSAALGRGSSLVIGDMSHVSFSRVSLLPYLSPRACLSPALPSRSSSAK